MAAETEAPHPHPPGLGFNLGAIALALALMGVALAYLIDGAARAERHAAVPDADLTLVRTLGTGDLEIPLGWFRYEEQRVDGLAKQIDLRLELPLGEGGRLAPVDVTLVPRSRVRPSANLLDGVYLHQFGQQQVSGPPGLVGKPLRPDQGFSAETVWYDPLSGVPFVAKCSTPIAPGAAGQCLRTVYLGPGIAAIYSFGDDLLGSWQQFDAVLATPLARIGAL